MTKWNLNHIQSVIKVTTRRLTTMTLTCICCFLVGLTVANAQTFEIYDTQPIQKPFIPSYTPGNMYIVRLSEPSVAVYEGGIEGYSATSAKSNGRQKFDSNSDNAKKYRGRLRSKQRELLNLAERSFNRSLKPKFQYQDAINGFAVELTLEEAKALGSMSGVVSVEPERMEYLLTDVGPSWIGAPELWNNGRESTQGEGMVIAVLDSGINSDHPSFADIGGDGYDHENPLGSGNYIPGSYCDTVDPSFCNDKLIGAWDFTDIDGTIPEDDDGHGSHTAATAAGNVLFDAPAEAPTATVEFNVSGVAPHANIIAYDVCQNTCPGAALVAAINQVIIDAGNLPNGITALNYSISGGGDPYNDTVELGFLAAVEAGIYVSASAGNSGPTAGTVAHLGPWVSTTAASTHSRQITNSITDINSNSGALAAISGLGFTSGYGPAKIVNSADYEDDYPGATLCGAGEAGSNTSPWPADFFNGEIVVCTRGSFGRVEKGINVLFSGAGGYVLIDDGNGLVGDPHVLPGVHISVDDGALLSEWLAANTDNNPMASIGGYSVENDPINGDIMAGFSSRGPQTVFDVLKPDVTAPGVDIFAADKNDDTPDPNDPEYQFLSGTSMSSPHNAGAGALLAATNPDWTPTEIKSALMLTGTNDITVKEDGITATDPFDLGAGRIDLEAANQTGLIMSESIDNFLAANPELGGDPSTLNIASMMDSNCVGECSWTRTVTNTLDKTGYWNVVAVGDGFEADVDIRPKSYNRKYNLVLRKGQSATIKVSVDNYNSEQGWQFGMLKLDSQDNSKGNFHKSHEQLKSYSRYNKYYSNRFKIRGSSGPDLAMPIAVQASKASNASLFTKEVDLASASKGDILSYEINITNGQAAGPITIIDKLPGGTKVINDSFTSEIVNGSTTSEWSYDKRKKQLSWTGELELGGLAVNASPAPFGYFSLGSFGVTPLDGCNGNCDDGGFLFTLPSFTFNGESYSEVIFSVNGTLEAGSASQAFTSFANQNLPDPTAPNNIIAPFWRDLNLNQGGNMYIEILSLQSGEAWTVFEWEDVPFYSDDPSATSPAVTMQVWIGLDGTPVQGDIHFIYDRLDDTSVGGTVGAENADGTIGTSYFFNGNGTAPQAGDQLLVSTLDGGSARLGFQVESKCRKGRIINTANLISNDFNEEAIAVTTCE